MLNVFAMRCDGSIKRSSSVLYSVNCNTDLIKQFLLLPQFYLIQVNKKWIFISKITDSVEI